MTRALEGEIVFAETTFVIMRKSNDETASFMFGLEEFFGKDESEQTAWKKIVAAIPGGDEVIRFLKHQVYTRIWRFAWLDQDEEYHGLYGWQADEVPSELRRPIPFVFCWRRRTGR